MRIVIDGQGAQTASRFRGIGRYSMGFIEAVARAVRGHEVILVLNGMLSESVIPIRRRLEGILPSANIRVWYSIGPTRQSQEGNQKNRDLALAVRREFIESLNPDVVHVTSLFEGFVDDAAIEGKWAQSEFIQTATLYDLIPLLFSDGFLTEAKYREHYERSISELTSFDALFGISHQSVEDFGNLLEAPRDLAKYVGIGFNVDDLNRVRFDSSLLQKPDPRNNSILVVAGDDSHKNIDFVVTAIAETSEKLRALSNLVFVGKLSESTQLRLKKMAQENGLSGDQLQFPGYVDDAELEALYRSSAALVMPSKYEGFGLPVLEAMAHGLPVAASNRGSLPEVVERADMTFDPDRPVELAKLLERIFFDTEFRQDAVEHGLLRSRAFNWQDVANRALQEWEALLLKRQAPRPRSASGRRVAIVSPLPPEQSGIADFTADLVPLLSIHWEITLIHPSAGETGRSEDRPSKLRSPRWLLQNWRSFDFVLYMFGNSPHHNFSYELLKRIPGIVVLHDVFLSSFFHWRSSQPGLSTEFERALVDTHGLRSLNDLALSAETARDVWQANWPVVKRATGIVVHSDHARDLLLTGSSSNMPPVKVLALPKVKPAEIDKSFARERLGIPKAAFVVASFGGVADTKCSQEVVSAFLKSTLGQANQSTLYLVGGSHGGKYGEDLADLLRAQDRNKKVHLMGYVSAEDYDLYMAASDIVVQLRAKSRGESSAALIDCLSRGLPTLINRHGSFAEIPDDVAQVIPDDFSLEELSASLDELFVDAKLRSDLARNALRYAEEKHVGPEAISRYASAVEELHETSSASPASSGLAIIRESGLVPSKPTELALFAQCLARTFPDRRAKTLFIDVTGSRGKAHVSGIERVVFELTTSLVNCPPEGVFVEPIYLDNVAGKWKHRRATNFPLNHDAALFEQPVVDVSPGDIVVVADISSELRLAAMDRLFDSYREVGAHLVGLVHDILPVTDPAFFPPSMEPFFRDWLDTVLGFDGVIANSRATADAVTKEAQVRIARNGSVSRLWVDSFQLGAFKSDSAAKENNQETRSLRGAKKIVMVGTIEPRKGYGEVLGAFEYLWGEGHDVELTIIGREGWKGVPEHHRRDIPHTVNQMNNMAEKYSLFTWLNDAVDSEVDAQLASATGLIAASYAEGYGLPIAEALVRGTPVLARDIPVFREFSGPGVSFFRAKTSKQLADQILSWVQGIRDNPAPVSPNSAVVSWRESAEQFSAVILDRLARSNQPATMIGNAT